MTSTEQHAILCEAGWRTDSHGKWVSPNPREARFAFSFAAAWRAHQAEHTTDAIDAAIDD